MLSSALRCGLKRSSYQPVGTISWRKLHAAATGESNSIVNVMFIGGGKMAEAMISGLLKNPKSFKVAGAVDINKSRRSFLANAFSIPTYENMNDGAEAISSCDLLVLAIKPQVADKVFEEIREVVPDSRRKDINAVSILAGVTVERLQHGLGLDNICRAMPNTPAQAQAGMTVWCTSPTVNQSTRKVLEKLFESCGEEEFVSDEEVLDACTALSGSGPAYFLLTMEALVDSGVHIGLSRELATRLVQQTMYGTAMLVQDQEKHVAVLRNDITSPGGTTSHALDMLERGGFRTTLSDSVWAAYRRSRELGNKDLSVGPYINR